MWAGFSFVCYWKVDTFRYIYVYIRVRIYIAAHLLSEVILNPWLVLLI